MPLTSIRKLEERLMRIEFGYKKMETGYEMTPAQLDALNEALGLAPKDGSYRPYHITCADMPRMALFEFGFQCPSCGAKIGFDLERLDPTEQTRIDESNEDRNIALRVP